MEILHTVIISLVGSIVTGIAATLWYYVRLYMKDAHSRRMRNESLLALINGSVNEIKLNVKGLENEFRQLQAEVDLIKTQWAQAALINHEHLLAVDSRIQRLESKHIGN